jgi:superfamily II DNA or RNA helicase
MKCIPPKTPVLFLTKDVSLVHQNYEEMQKWGIQDLGRYYGKYREPNYIMCCNTHAKTLESLKSLLPKFKVLIVDESHSCLSKKPIAAYNKMTSARVRIGISATPFKFKGKDLEQKWNAKGYFGPIFQTKTTESGKLTTKNLQDRDILSASQCNFYVIDHPKIWHEPYLDAVTLGIANNFEFHKIVTRLARSLKGRTLVLVERLDQGEYLKQLMPEANWISGSDKIEVKSGVFKELREKETSITIAMRHIITAGINVFLHNLINASGGKAEHSIVQQMGRGLRLANDKEILNYYDFIYHINDYLLEHSTNRISVLKEEGHEVILKEEFDF